MADDSTDGAARQSSELVIFGPELHGWVYKPLLEVAKESLGDARVGAIAASFGVTESQLVNRETWVTQAFAEAFIDALLCHGLDPQALDRAARLCISPRYLGPLYAFLRAFGDVASTYERAGSSTPRYNKTGVFATEHLSANSVRMTFTSTPATRRDRTGYLCRFRSVSMATVPTLFDLAPARVREPKCMARGDDCCVYELTWQEPPRRWAGTAGAMIALIAALLLSSSLSLDSTAASAVCMISMLAGFALGRMRMLQQDVSARVQDVTDHQDALTRSMRANEERFEELLQAKAEVDHKVELRTKEWQDATRQLSLTLDEIQALDRAKTDFFNNVSHELRSPLTLILAPLEDMVAGRAPASGAKAAIETMHRNATRLLRLINQLLDLAKIDAGEVVLAPTPTDLPQLVRTILAGFEAAARTRGVALELFAPATMATVALDVSWIDSAITNLVANALRLTKRGGGVRVRIQDDGGDVSIAVADDGPGIAPQDHSRVFQRFAQGDSTKKVVGGTGIGLALVREAARLHAGAIKLTSELGKGATFTLTLPRRSLLHGDDRIVVMPTQPPPQHVVDDFREDSALDERSGPTEHAPLALVVEDNSELRAFIMDVLAVRYRVRGVNDAARAVELLHELQPAVVVSDVAMPEMSGHELCRRMRKNPDTQSTPLLLVTARGEIASVLEGFEAGANDYVLKPFHGRELLARVDVHVRLQRLAQELAVRERHAALGVLAASVAHQIRNPLTSLMSGLPAMRARFENTSSKSTLELIDVMIDCGARIERTTRDLLDLSRIDRELGGQYRPSDGLAAAVRLVRARLPATVVLTEQIAESGLTTGRPGDMNHVFLNVLDNAIRAASPTGEVLVSAATEGDCYVARIADSGTGVDAQIAQHIFKPFFTTRPAGQGTGLGLAIAAQVMQQCGGRIELGRAQLGGAELKVCIPLRVHASSPQLTEADDVAAKALN